MIRDREDKNDKVSIITPTYNSSKYIEETITSVINQTYDNWEMIIVDDCSNDDTCKIIEDISKKDERIKLIKLKENLGAANARNVALRNSNGYFIAYLDADDLWSPSKLKKQISFMKNKQCGFSCSSYDVIDSEGKSLDKKVIMKEVVDYKGFLINNLLQTVGIMVDLNIVDKKYLEMPNMKRRQDAATWLQILKAGYKCYGIEESLCKYRRVSGSLSSNKFKAVKGVWYLYRNVEKLGLIFSCYCFIRYSILAVWKRIYIGKYLSKLKSIMTN